MFSLYSAERGASAAAVVAVVAAAMLLMPHEARAQAHPSAYWNGLVTSWAAGGGRAGFNTAATGGAMVAVAPDATTNVFFSTQTPVPAHLALTLDGNVVVNSLTFRAGGGAVAISPGTGGAGQSLTLMGASANGITLEAGAGAVVISAPVVLGAPQSWVNRSSSDLTVKGAISGSGSLTLSSTGTGGIIFDAPNLYTGSTILAGGKLTLGQNGGINLSSSVTILPAGTLEVRAASAWLRNLNGFGGVVDLHGTSLVLWNDTATQFNGTIQGTATALTKTGNAALTLVGSQTYTGPTAVTGGTLVIGADTAAAHIGSSVTVFAPAVLEVRAQGSVLGTLGVNGTASVAATSGGVGVTVNVASQGSGSVHSTGHIKGGQGGSLYSMGTAAQGLDGGAGVVLWGGANHFEGSVAGGVGGLGILTQGGVAGNGGLGAAGMVVHGGSVYSAAVVQGGQGGGSSMRGHGGAGGAGMTLDGPSILTMGSAGTITGGRGGAGGAFSVTAVGTGGAGGAGLSSRTSGTVTLSGTITGGEGGAGGRYAGGTGGMGGNGGAGLLVTTGTGLYISSAHITGGAGGAGGTGAVNGAAGVAGTAVSFSGGGHFTNLPAGMVTAVNPTVPAVSFGGGLGVLVNQGTITGAVNFGGEGTLENSGMVGGKVTFLDKATFDNHGTVLGDVTMGNAENHATLHMGGMVNGSLLMGTSPDSTLTLDGTGTQALSAAVTGTTALNGWLLKEGTGTWNINNGTLVHSGPTVVKAGKLAVLSGGWLGNTSGLTVNEGATFEYASGIVLDRRVTVKDGGTFAYNSATIFAGRLFLEYGATVAGSGNMRDTTLALGVGTIISPGGGIGTLATGSQIWMNGGNYHWQLLDAAGSAGSGHDVLAIHGTLDLTTLAAAGFQLNLWTASSGAPGADGPALNFHPEMSYSWIIVSTTDGIQGFRPANFKIHTEPREGTGGFQNTVHGIFSVTQVGNNLVLTYTGVPEPAVAGMMVVMAGLLGMRRRR